MREPDPHQQDHPAVRSGLRTLRLEQAGLAALAEALGGALGPGLAAAVERIASLSGRVIVTGMGKSGHVGRKIAATLASTGTPAHFVHPGEASHGDLGMIGAQDAVLALSWSGETPELADILAYARRFRVPLVAVTSNADSALARGADIPLVLPRAAEACPNGLAPTTSTLMQLALGDALAVALLEARGFSARDFREFHPGGRLGSQLKSVASIMHTGERLPVARAGAPMSEAVVTMSAKGFGCVLVEGEGGLLKGIVTDGDLRRHMGDDLMRRTVDEVMTRTPVTIAPDALVAEALERVETQRRGALVVVENGRAVGLVHVLDLLRAGAA